MELKTLNCPNCNGHLEIEDGIDTFFCKYCGNKIVLDGQSDAAYQAKVKIKELEHEQVMQENKYKNDQAEWERNETTKKRENWRKNKSFLFMFAPLILMMLFFLPQMIKHQKIYREVSCSV